MKANEGNLAQAPLPGELHLTRQALEILRWLENEVRDKAFDYGFPSLGLYASDIEETFLEGVLASGGLDSYEWVLNLEEGVLVRRQTG